MISLGDALRAFERAREVLNQVPLGEDVLARLEDAAGRLLVEQWLPLHGLDMKTHYANHPPASDAELVDGLTVRRWIVGGNAFVRLRIVMLSDDPPLDARLELEIDRELWSSSEALCYTLHLVTNIPLPRAAEVNQADLAYMVARLKSVQPELSDLSIIQKLQGIGVTNINQQLLMVAWAFIRRVAASDGAADYWGRALEAHDRVAAN